MTTLPLSTSEQEEKRVDVAKPNGDGSTSDDQFGMCTPAASDSGFRPTCQRFDTGSIVSNDQPLDFSMKKTERKLESSSLSPNSIASDYTGCFSQTKLSPIPSTPSPKPYGVDSPLSSVRYPLTPGYRLSSEVSGATLPYPNVPLSAIPSSIIGHPMMPGLPTVLSYTKVSGVTKQKSLRPFKAYRCDARPVGFNYPGIPHLDLAYSPDSTTTHNLFAQHDAYLQFRRRMLAQKKSPNLEQTRNSKVEEPCSSQSISTTSSPDIPVTGEASRVVTASETSAKPVSRCQAAVVSTTYRKRTRTLPDEMKDETYWERRKKNNEAAKRSRDARRAKEDELAIKTAFLEQDNIRLTVEVNTLRSEIRGLRCMLYSS